MDTSVLTGAYCQESGSHQAQRVLQDHEPAISSLTRLELSSAIAKKVRAGTLSRDEATRIIAEFQIHIRDGVFELLAIQAAHYALANDWMDACVTAVRTLEALHLALAHSNGLTLITADKALARAGEQLGAKIKML